MKGMLTVVLIGGAATVAAIVSPSASVQAWGPFALLSTGVGMLAAWVVASDHTAPAAHTAPHKRAA